MPLPMASGPQVTKPTSTAPISSRTQRLQKLRDRLDTEWQQVQAEERSNYAVERCRQQRTATLLDQCAIGKGTRIADLGCGNGAITALMSGKGAQITALDTSATALELIKAKKLADVTTIQATLPSTPLEDGAYDLVVSTDVIGDLDPRDHRLYISELARLVSRNGLVLCSTELDSRTEAPLALFATMMTTEFDVLAWRVSHHHLYRRTLAKLPALRQSKQLLELLEKASYGLWLDDAATHAICLAQRRPLFGEKTANHQQWQW